MASTQSILVQFEVQRNIVSRKCLIPRTFAIANAIKRYAGGYKSRHTIKDGSSLVYLFERILGER